MAKYDSSVEGYTLQRKITWVDAFFISSGVSVGLLFSLGSIGATVGTSAWLIWLLSATIAFVQTFTYAEIAGMFPNKSGGASVYGAIAWVKYAKPLAPVSVWSNWLAWSPVLAFSTQIMAGYLLNAFFPPSSVVHTWVIKLIDLGFIKEGLSIRIDSKFILSLLLVLFIFYVQGHGILRTAKAQKVAAILAFVPLLFVGIFPLVTGKINFENLKLLPTIYDAAGNPMSGIWNAQGITIFLGGLYLCAWSTYGVENAVCYTSEYKNPKRDTSKALMAAGLFCILMCTLVPISFYGTLGLEKVLDPGVASGETLNLAMAEVIGGGTVVKWILLIALIIALFVVIMTAMAGSSRTLYQASVDGWLPRYLTKVNKNGAPVYAMATDLGFNVLLLLISDYNFLLACANLNYMVFVFFNLNAIWIHRKDRPDMERPYRTPNFFVILNVCLAFFNVFLIGIGADLWGNGTLIIGLCSVLVIVPVFWFRHYHQDKGRFPDHFQKELDVVTEKKAAYLPYISLALGIAVMILGKVIFNNVI